MFGAFLARFCERCFLGLGACTLKKFLFALIGLFVVLVAAALIVPSFIDWSVYKEEISRQVKQTTGRDLVLAGDLRLTVLPAPTLSVEDVRLTNLPGAAAPFFAKLRSLEIRIGLLPLLSGQIEVKTIALVEPVIELEVLADGRHNWEFTPPVAVNAVAELEAPPVVSAAPDAPADKGADKEDEAAAPGMLAGAISVNRFTIEGGTLVYRNAATGAVDSIKNIDAELAAESLAGPFRAKGSLVARDIPFEFELGMEGLEKGRAARISLEVGARDINAEAKISGLLTEPSADAKLTGRLQVSGENLALVYRTFARSEPPVKGLARSFSIDGTMVGSASDLRIDEMNLQVGELEGKGRVTVELKEKLQADIGLNFDLIDLDRLLQEQHAEVLLPARPVLLQTGFITAAAAQQVAAPEVAPKVVPEAAPEAAPENGAAVAPASPPPPAEIAATLDLVVDRIIWRRDTVQEMRINASLLNGEVTLNQATAVLPGEGTVSLFGFVAPVEGVPQFDGTMEAQVKDLRHFLGWLDMDLSGVPDDGLRSLEVQGDVRARPLFAELRGIDLRLDASRIAGKVRVDLGDRPVIDARLNLDKLNLNSYLPKQKTASLQPATGPQAETAGVGLVSEALAAPAAAGGGAAALPALDAQLDLSVGKLSFRKLNAKGLRLAASLKQGALVLRELSVKNAAGARAKLSGSATGLPVNPEVDFRFDAGAKSLSSLLKAMDIQSPMPEKALVGFTLKGTIKGNATRATFATEAGLAGARLTGDGEVSSLIEKPSFSLATRLRHADLSGLMRSFGGGYRPAGNLGPLDLAGRVEGDANRLSFSHIQGAIGPVSVQGEIKADTTGIRPRLVAELSTSEINADLFLPAKSRRSSAPARQGGGGGNGKKASGASSAKAGRWSKEPFNLAPLKQFDAEAALRIAAVSYGNIRVDRPEITLQLANGVVEVSRVSGEVFGGTFQAGARLAALDVPAMRFNMRVRGADLKNALFQASNFDLARGKMDLDLNLDGAGRNMFELVPSLSGKGLFKVNGGEFKGFDLSAVSDRMKRLDEPLDILKVIRTALSGGSTQFTEMAGNFTVAKGIARTQDLRMVAKAGEAKVQGSVDLPAWQVDMNAEFLLTEHKNTPPFAMRISGPLDNPKRVFDLNRLQSYLLQRGAGTVIKRLLPKQNKLIEKLLPGGASEAGSAPTGGETAPAPSQEQAPKAPRPEDLLRDLLKGL
jgi:uncharacterized protein involved in outer membrane biogenesis